MLKLARITGIVLFLSVMLVGCSDPSGYFLSRSAYYKTTPTPIAMTPEQLAGLMQNQLTLTNQVPVESVTAGQANDLVIRYTANDPASMLSSPEGQNVLMAVGRALGGYYDLSYAKVGAITVVPVLGGQAGAGVTAKATDIVDWYNGRISQDVFLSRWTPSS